MQSIKHHVKYIMLCLAFYSLATLIIPSAQAQVASGWSDDDHAEHNPFALTGHGSGRKWLGSANIYHNTSGAPEGYQSLIEYGAWSWSQRTGASVNYIGETTSQGGQDGRITVVWIDAFEMYDLRGSFSTKGVANYWYNTNTGEILGVRIYINSTMYESADDESRQVTFNHELGHALGVTHSSTYSDVMYTYGGNTYALSYNDVYRAEYGDYTCHAELTKENDIYIPYAAGMSALLRFDGVNRWTLDEYEFSDGVCSTVTLDSEGALVFTDVRGIGMSLTYVRMISVGADTWELEYAE